MMAKAANRAYDKRGRLLISLGSNACATMAAAISGELSVIAAAAANVPMGLYHDRIVITSWSQYEPTGMDMGKVGR